jgi:hypothetical protein
MHRIMYPNILKSLFKATLADVHELVAFECVSICQQVLDTPSSEEVDIGSNLSRINWLTEQCNDPTISRVANIVKAH